MNRKLALGLLAIIGPGVTACATTPETRGPAVATGWQTLATTDDRQRLREWRTSFARALAGARAAGHGPAIAGEAALLQPDAAIGGAIPNGEYRCRIIKLGARQAGMLPFVSYPVFACRIASKGSFQAFVTRSGSQRQVGTIYPHDKLRGVFLGTLVLGDEARAMPYGADPERDLAGWVERIDERRWRLLLPAPRFESLFDVIELVPA